MGYPIMLQIGRKNVKRCPKGERWMSAYATDGAKGCQTMPQRRAMDTQLTQDISQHAKQITAMIASHYTQFTQDISQP
jgi:hypothetical protein